jgi:diaminopimelate decarboxylase
MTNTLPFSLLDIKTLSQTNPTPFYIYDAKAIESNAQYFRDSFVNQGFQDYANY